MVRSWRHDAMAGGCRRALLRGRLQPRAVAAGRLAPGRAADARGRGQSGDGGRVLVGLAGAGGGPLRVRLARRRARPAPRARDQGRPRDLDALNQAWGTAFWSQRYGDWDEVDPPRPAPTFVNLTRQLDWWRFSSNELLECFRAEREALARHTPSIPITTNLMAARFKTLDYWSWAPELDLIANDHYLIGEDPDGHIDLALAGDPGC